ncbi:MAG: efflux RND transporter periplasmic adaptor subunit [Nitrospinales bacterium]
MFLFALILCVGVGCTKPESEAPKGEGRKLVLPVQIGKVVYRDVVDKIRVVGNILAEQRVSVPSEIAGQIARIPVDEGTKVKQGALLASIDSREYVLEVQRLEADLISAGKEHQKSTTGLRPEEKEKLQAQVTADKSSLELAQKSLKRTEKLVAEGVVSQSFLDEAIEKASRTQENLRFSEAALSASSSSRDEDISKLKSDLDSTQKKLEIAKLNLSKSRILAPFSGVIISKNVEKGAYVSRGMPIVEMIGSSSLKAVIEIPQTYRGKLEKLKEIEFYIQDMDLRFKVEKDFDKLVRVIPDANIFSGNVRVQVDLPKPDKSLFPGLTLEAKLSFDTRKNILHVPSISLSITEQGSVVYTVKEGKANIVPVKTFKERDDFVEVEDFTHQLNPESVLVLRGSGAVFPGVDVMVTNPRVDTTKNAAGPPGQNKPGEKPAPKQS